jgi:hypothetical protein
MATTYAITAGAANAVARPAKSRVVLGIYNQSTTATVYVAFDTPAIAAATAGQFTLQPATATNIAQLVFPGPDPQNVPTGAVNIIASAAATPVTIVE